jgi:alanine-alpha-ketoisovalerate/valine-pyruvate aminotransferase
MTKDQARKLLPAVNDPQLFPLIKAYTQQRIDVLRSYLETADDPVKIHKLQGAIAELRRFDTLRDEVIEHSK